VVGIVDGSSSSSVVVVIVNRRLGGGYRRWVEGAVDGPSSLPRPTPPPLPCLALHLLDFPGVVNSNRFVVIDSCCSGGIALLWWNCVVVVVGFLWQLGGYKCQ